MNEDGLCIGCGRECLDIIECRCGRRELCACEECRESGINLVCGVCRDRAERVVLSGSHPCRDCGAEGDPGGRLPVTAPVGAW